MKSSKFTSRLIISILIFLISVSGVYMGFRFLRIYSSNSFVLRESIQNIHKEREDTIRSKNIFLGNLERIQSLSSHVISSQEEIPYLVSKIEEYADDINSNIVINSISLEEIKKPSESEENYRSLIIDISATGSFDSLMRSIKMIENADYIINIDEYYIREVAVIEPNRPGGSTTYRDISFTDDSSSIKNKTWMLTSKLKLNTKIK